MGHLQPPAITIQGTGNFVDVSERTQESIKGEECFEMPVLEIVWLAHSPTHRSLGHLYKTRPAKTLAWILATEGC